MPKFEVTTMITYEFEAESAREAQQLVEDGEMPKKHHLVSAFVADVNEVHQ